MFSIKNKTVTNFQKWLSADFKLYNHFERKFKEAVERSASLQKIYQTQLKKLQIPINRKLFQLREGGVRGRCEKITGVERTTKRRLRARRWGQLETQRRIQVWVEFVFFTQVATQDGDEHCRGLCGQDRKRMVHPVCPWGTEILNKGKNFIWTFLGTFHSFRWERNREKGPSPQW